MKKEWMEPVVEVQEFAANEYVAACGDSGKVYKFVCDAGRLSLVGSEMCITDSSWGGWGSQAQFSGYHPCNKTHEAESDSGFISGFIDDQSTRNDEATPVVIWTENGTNVHCTTRLDINTWETAKS